MSHTQPSIDQAVQFRNRLITILSHETKGLFANIFWLIELIENDLTDPGMLRQMLPELKSVAQKNLDDYTDTLSWIKTQREDFVLQHIKINVHELFCRLQEFFKQRLVAKERQLIFNGDASIGFFSDKILVELILKKIIENILNSSCSGKMIIFKISKSADNKEIGIKITDSDTEIDKAALPEMFHDKANAADEINAKMDIGTQFVRDIASVLNGSIDIASQTNNTTDITLTLPLN